MYQPAPHPSPPPSPSSVHAPIPLRSTNYSTQGRWTPRSRSSSIDSADSTGALVGLGYNNSSSSGQGSSFSQQLDHGLRRPVAHRAQATDDMVEILLPTSPPPNSYQQRPSAADDLYDDPTPTPSSYAFAPNPSQQPSYAGASHSYSHSYAPSIASSIGGRSVFDREGGYAPGMSRSTSQAGSVSSFAGSEIADKFDYTTWDMPPANAAAHAEPDDWLHDVGTSSHSRGSIFTLRGLYNLGCLAVLVVALFMLFAGYPIITVLSDRLLKSNGAFNLGGVNGTGQVPSTVGNFGLIDNDTPQEALTRTGIGGANEGVEYELVFSDEFEQDGRTFWPGDDPYWEAASLHYWATNNLEFYDQRMITVANGSLQITLQPADPSTNHNLNYTGGMLSSWNKFCFTGGYMEVKARLPGSPKVWGLWPAVWTLGNLGRAGYGATLDGMWPYTYDACDLGTLKNQTYNDLPEAALTTGQEGYNYTLSYLPGQRLSRCTCASDPTHPGPYSNRQFAGRGAPEIDLFEAQVDETLQEGKVSMSGQWAPFDASYQWNATDGSYVIYNTSLTELNGYKGGITQESSSGIVTTNQEAYQYPLSGGTGEFSVYGFEYQPGTDAYIAWVSDSKPAWTVYQSAVGPNNETEISERPIPTEPMYIIANLGISNNFGNIDYDGLGDLWPVRMDIDYIRVYQRTGQKNIGCDPEDRPTAAYIDEHIDLYSNPNLTLYTDGGYVQPLNRLQLESEGKTC